MKKACGPEMISFPLPVVIVGALVKGKPNFNAIAYCGVAQSKPPILAVSMDKKRYTYRGIVETGCFSVNIPSKDMLPQTNHVGTSTGHEVDKSEMFAVFYGKLGKAPLIQDCPAAIECELLESMDFGGKNDLLIGKIIESYVDEGCILGGKLDFSRLQPLIFSRSDHGYWGIGKSLGTTDDARNAVRNAGKSQ
jgi:flavin reductase (DIM6/NTAB) family NADH-FMN oxidoreductase RutF